MKYPKNHIASSAKINNSVIIPPCFIGDDVIIESSVVGPHVSIGKNTKVTNSILKNSIVRDHTQLIDAGIDNSLIGNYVHYHGQLKDLSIGDYSTES